MRRILIVTLATLIAPGVAQAHAPSTSIGRAVTAFEQVSVSYEPGAAVTDIEAGRFPLIVGSNPKVAFIAASAEQEITGGPNVIASEIAREASIDGTLVVLVGTKLGAWSDEIGDDRLAALVEQARTSKAGTSTAVVVESLVRSVQTEPTDSRPPWGWIGAILVALTLSSLVAYERIVRSRSRAATRTP